MTEYAFSQQLFDEPAVTEGDPIIAPLVREQLEELIGGPRNSGVGGPERALMRALLQDAVLCLMGQAAPAKERARLAEDARYWVRSRSREWVFSFANVCEVLGIDPDTARRKLLAMSDGTIEPTREWRRPSGRQRAARCARAASLRTAAAAGHPLHAPAPSPRRGGGYGIRIVADPRIGWGRPSWPPPPPPPDSLPPQSRRSNSRESRQAAGGHGDTPRVYAWTGGRRSFHGAACSSCAPTWSSRSSRP